MAKELAEGAEEAQAKRAYFERVKAKKAHTWTGAHQPRPKPGQAFHHCRKHQYGWNKSRPIDCRFATLDESTGAITFDSNAAMAERERTRESKADGKTRRIGKKCVGFVTCVNEKCEFYDGVIRPAVKRAALDNVHVMGANPLFPCLVSTRVQEMNPFVYITYADDSDQIGDSSSSTPCITSSTVVTKESVNASSSASDTIAYQYKVTVFKQEALEYLKQVMLPNRPSNDTLFERIFLVSAQQKSILEKRFGPVTNSTKQIEGWVNGCNTWGERTSRKSDGKKVEGRWLWVLLDKYLDVNVIEDLAKYERHCRHHPMSTIGYARKLKRRKRTSSHSMQPSKQHGSSFAHEKPVHQSFRVAPLQRR